MEMLYDTRKLAGALAASAPWFHASGQHWLSLAAAFQAFIEDNEEAPTLRFASSEPKTR